MANYDDIVLSGEWVEIPVADEDTIIFADGPMRITSHTDPAGKTIGIPLPRDHAYPVRADATLFARSDTASTVTLVRNSH